MSLMSRTCTILSRTAGTAVDDYGNQVQSTTGTAEVSCDIQQINTQAPGEQGEFSISDWIGFLPTGTAIDTGDAISEPTLGTFEVVGRPWDANSGSSAVNHVEVRLREAEG